MFDLARKLAEALSAQVALKSKSERGYELIDGQPDGAVKAAPVDLSGDVRTRDAFRLISHACLKQVAGNHAALVAGDPEGVHQMRVGLRRLRAAMSLFSPLLGDAETDAIKRELKWLAGELGPAREWEVLMDRVVAPVKQRRSRRRDGIPSLSQDLAKRRDAALERSQKAVTSDRFRALILDVMAWLETGTWRRPQDDLVRSRGDMPIEASAAEQLQRRWRKVRKKGKALAELDKEHRHRLRIQVKKLRYAAEFFGDLFAGKRASKRRKKFAAALEHLQDGLGDLNDIRVDEALIAAASVRRKKPNPKRAFAAGLLTGHEEARFDKAMNAAAAGYEQLVNVKPFWQ